MRILAAAVLGLASLLVAAQDAAPDPRITRLIQDLSKTRTPREAALSPDGKMLVWTVSGSMHLVSTDSLSSDRILSPESVADRANQTLSKCNSSSPVWSADSSQLAFLSTCDAKGVAGRQSQIWVFNAVANSAKQLTHATGSITGPQWSPDGKTIAFLFVPNATRSAGALDAMKPAVGVIGRDNVEVQRLEAVDIRSGRDFALVASGLYVYEFAWSPDSQRVVMTAANPPGENNWWVAKIFVQDARQAIECAPNATCPTSVAYPKPNLLVDPAAVSGPLHGLQIALPRFSPSGHDVAFIGGLMSDFGSTGGDLYITKADGTEAGKDVHSFTAGRKASIAWFQWADADHVMLTERMRGRVHLAILGTSGKQLPYFSETFDGSLGSGTSALSLSVSISSRSIAAVRSAFDRAPEVWYGAPNNLKQVSHLNDGLKPAWGKAESIEYKNDGFDIQGFVLYPAHYDPAKKYGLVTYVHGGPSAASGSAWPAAGFGAAPFSAMDYFVFLPNPRGSYGQGEAFVQANRKDFGYGDLRDILAGVDVLEKRFPIDKDRIGVTGWSYGGFMTMFSVTQTTRFKAAVAGAGISNWQSYYGENSIDQWMMPFFGASVYDDPAVYAKSSAINYIKDVKTPTLIVVGDRDGECPAPQSFEFWHALKAQGVTTELVVYPNEGHGFRDPAHRIDVLTRAIAWFDKEMPAK